MKKPPETIKFRDLVESLRIPGRRTQVHRKKSRRQLIEEIKKKDTE
jgi:hypothetical protein